MADKNKVTFQINFEGLEDLKKQMKGASKAFTDSLEDFGKTAKQVGRDIKEVGSSISFLGAGISGPLILAFKNASNYSADVYFEIKRLKDTTDEFQKLIAKSLVPIFRDFNNLITKMVLAFKGLDESLRNQVLQGALVTGVFLTLSGLLTIMAGKIITLVGNLAILSSQFLVFATLNPIFIALSVSIVGLIYLMLKFKPVGDVILNTFKVVFLVLKDGFYETKSAATEFLETTLTGLSKVFEGFAHVPNNALAVQMTNLANSTAVAANEMGVLADKAKFDAKSAIEELGNVITTGQSDWSLGFDDLKTKVTEFFELLRSKSDETTGKTILNDKKGLEIYKRVNEDKLGSLTNTLKQASALNKNFGVAYQVFAISEAIINTAVGVTAALSRFDFISAALIAAEGAIQIGTIASQSFAVGTDNIPRDMTANVHKGEIIIPKDFSEAIRKGNLSLSGKDGGNGISFNFTGATFNGITDTLVRDIFTKASENIRKRVLAPLPI